MTTTATWLHVDRSDYSLRPSQLAAAATALEVGGLLGQLGVGSGKTLLLLLLGTLLPSERPLLLVPASLRAATEALHAEYRRHWALRPLPVISYEMLSSPTRRPLDDSRPDLLLCDEAHYLRSPSAARTRRVSRYLRQRPETRVVAVSGTLLGSRVGDYRHLARWALGRKNPLERLAPTQIQQLDRLLSGEPSPPLSAQVCWGRLLEYDPLRWRARWERLLSKIPGVVVSRSLECDATLVLRGTAAAEPPPDELEEWLSEWELPGRVACDALSYAAVARQLALGIYYRWQYDPRPDWLAARRAWSAAVRAYLPRSGPERDSPALLLAAAERGRLPTEALQEAWPAWARLRHIDPPPTECVVVDMRRRRAIVELALSFGNCLVWHPYREPLPGLPVAPLGGTSPTMTGGPLVVSPQAHGVGHNLQAWSQSLVLEPSPSGDRWEQLLGRTHRAGQRANTVTYHYLADTELAADSLRRALQEGSPRLRAATHIPSGDIS